MPDVDDLCNNPFERGVYLGQKRVLGLEKELRLDDRHAEWMDLHNE